MKKMLITVATIGAYLAATLPSPAGETAIAKPPVGQATIIVNSGTPLSPSELAEYEQKARQASISHEGAGAEASPELIILGCIGALVVIGAVIYAANKNNSGN